MRVSIIFRLSKELQRLIVGPNVAYSPDCDLDDHDSLSDLLTETFSDVLIVRTIPAAVVLRKWRSYMPSDLSLTVICIDEDGFKGIAHPQIGGVSFHLVNSNEMAHPEVAAMQIAESLSNGRLSNKSASYPDSKENVSGQSVILVGGGVVNLVTAYYLVNAGYSVTVLERAADPTTNVDWRLQGCTFGGGDARIFSLNEGRQHLFKGYQYTSTTNTQFNLRVRDGGWLIRSPDEYDALTREWIDVSQQVPLWLAGRFDKDIISFNQESEPLWRRMMDEAPELFQDVGFNNGVLRLYATPEQYNQALVKERQIGSIVRELNLDKLAFEFPSLRDGLDTGNISGALEVVGFSVNVQKFSLALGRYIASRGGKLKWSADVTKVLRDGQGRINGMQLNNNEIVRSSHYVVSPGAFGNKCLAGFRSENKIAGIVGMWLTLPDITEMKLDRPLKISRKGFAANGAAEGANVICGTDKHGKQIINLSSGHGLVGVNPAKLDSDQLHDLTRAVHETAQQYFPLQYSLAQELGYLAMPARYCIRPWTSTGLGLFETAPSVNGGMAIVTGGHNTGGFAQAPSVGQAVVAALSGHLHRMHTLYDPDRLLDFCSTREQSPAMAEAEI